MNTFIKTALIIGTLFLSFGVKAEGPGPRQNNRYFAKVSGSQFTSLSINTAKTFDAIDVGGYTTALVEIQYTFSTASHVKMTCEESPDNSTWFAVPEVDGTDPPYVEHAQRIWRWTVTTSLNFFFEVPLRYRYLRCSIVTEGGDASDTASVGLFVSDG